MAQREDFELLKAVENATNYYLIDEDKTQPQNTRRMYTRPQKEWKRKHSRLSLQTGLSRTTREAFCPALPSDYIDNQIYQSDQLIQFRYGIESDQTNQICPENALIVFSSTASPYPRVFNAIPNTA
ncbi:hypothetical protein B0J13DRAFT_533368 [Dactylonectria estremocensis]|uniref:Uncharacterized protein n=1 Tax=Dactylonectria estremocensis TaxID=1079267 RepID=A0A9P9IBM0_9HYPO|nr:hypothetical protein B0J13DRAFT_533368 [Dactylonectria estremocensis]